MSIPGTRDFHHGLLSPGPRPPAAPALGELLLDRFTAAAGPDCRWSLRRCCTTAEVVGKLAGPGQTLVIQHPDRGPGLHLEQSAALERDEVISAHDRLDPFLLEQPLEHVAVNGVRSEVELLEGRHGVRRRQEAGDRRQETGDRRSRWASPALVQPNELSRYLVLIWMLALADRFSSVFCLLTPWVYRIGKRPCPVPRTATDFDSS